MRGSLVESPAPKTDSRWGRGSNSAVFHSKVPFWGFFFRHSRFDQELPPARTRSHDLAVSLAKVARTPFELRPGWYAACYCDSNCPAPGAAQKSRITVFLAGAIGRECGKFRDSLKGSHHLDGLYGLSISHSLLSTGIYFFWGGSVVLVRMGLQEAVRFFLALAQSVWVELRQRSQQLGSLRACPRSAWVVPSPDRPARIPVPAVLKA